MKRYNDSVNDVCLFSFDESTEEMMDDVYAAALNYGARHGEYHVITMRPSKTTFYRHVILSSAIPAEFDPISSQPTYYGKTYYEYLKDAKDFS